VTALAHRAFPLVLAAPSGTGKTSIARALVNGSGDFVFSVSVTTRQPRGRERDGVDYHFVSEEGFRRMIADGELVEWAEVHGALYGTPRSAIEAPAERGQHVVLDIDVEGASQVRERIPDAVLVFVFPPSAAALVSRLTRRGTEAREDVERRLSNARAELASATDFDYVVENEALDDAVAAVRAIVASEGHRPRRARAIEQDIHRLQAEIDDVLSVANSTNREG
jgi:guanylate kinase